MPFERIISPSVAEVGTGLGKQIQVLDRMLERPHAAAPVSDRGLLEAIGRVLWQLSGLSAEEVLEALRRHGTKKARCGWWLAVRQPNTCPGSSFITIIQRSAF